MLPNDRNDNQQTGVRLVHSGSRQLFRYWESLRAERACPTRDEIDLSRISNILPNITVIDEAEPRFWRHRMAGSDVCALLSEQVTYRDALLGFDRQSRDALTNLFGIAVQQAQPAIIRLRLIGQHHVLPAEMLALPVFDQKSGQHQLFCGLFGFNTELAVGGAPLLRRALLSAKLIRTEHGLNSELATFRTAPQFQVIKGGLS